MTECLSFTTASAFVMMRLTQYDDVEASAFQSCVVSDQFHTVMPRALACGAVFASKSPYGGRNTHGTVPTIASCSAVVLSISAPCCGPDSVDRCLWSHVWLPSRCPSAAISRTRSGWACMCSPTLKNVARTPYLRSTANVAGVLGPGPSSKVSATVLPDPVPCVRTPVAGLGQGAAVTAVGPDEAAACNVVVVAGTVQARPTTTAAARRRGRERTRSKSNTANVDSSGEWENASASSIGIVTGRDCRRCRGRD